MQVRISEQEGSWIASLTLLGALAGGLVSGLLIKHGRRRTLIWTSIPLSGSWIATVFANCVEMIYATAFVAGFCSSIIQLAVSERHRITTHTLTEMRLNPTFQIKFWHLGRLFFGVWAKTRLSKKSKNSIFHQKTRFEKAKT